ncbi:MAG: amidohydrolase family protein [Alphaproteobacteria bacterium]|nr:amidohydrolase family protein [Alphaproteobacteria bacterium]
MIVDAHQHFWDPARGDYDWLKPDNPIHRVFGTADLRPLLVQAGVEAAILVQAAPTPAETDYMLGIARNTPFVLGVVGWVDLLAPDAAEEVRRRAADPLFLGLRPMLQDIPDPEWVLQPGLTPALNAVAAEGLVFDALILSHQLDAIAELARRHPQLSIVLDHAAKPRLGEAGAMAAWARGIEALAARPNVTCKVSGLLTELRPGGTRDDVVRGVGVLFDLFGPERLIWGSDWPVLTLSNCFVGAGDYQGWFELAREAVAAKDASAVGAVMGGNALRIYQPDKSRLGRHA